MRISDWSSDVCSSDLPRAFPSRCKKARALQRGPPPQRFLRLPCRRFGALSLTGVHSLAVMPGCADFAHVRELDAAELAVVVDVGLVEAFAAALFHARLEVRSEEHTSELQSLMRISYAVFCLKKK